MTGTLLFEDIQNWPIAKSFVSDHTARTAQADPDDTFRRWINTPSSPSMTHFSFRGEKCIPRVL